MTIDDMFEPQNALPPNGHDWRLPENRMEAFSRIVHVRMAEGDLDHHHSGKVIASEMGLDDDQKILYSLLFGQSYRNHWSMLAMQIFPDLLTISEEKLRKWHDANWWRMKFGNDTKWNVRRFPEFVISLQKKLRGARPFEYFSNIANVGDTEKNYRALNDELRSLSSIGRMTAWLAQQTLYEFFHWDIDHWDQQLYDNGTWSQYDSLCYIFDRLDIARTQKTENGLKKYSPSAEDIKLMESKTTELMEFVNSRIPFHVDIYNVESAECEFRKTAYGPKIKEFTFWTTNELVEQYMDLKGLWDSYEGSVKPDWTPYVKALMTKGRVVSDFGYDKSYFRVFSEYGLNLNTHVMYTDELDAHKLLCLPKNQGASVQGLLADWAKIPATEQARLIAKYDPIKYLQFKPQTHESWSDANLDQGYLRRYRQEFP